MNRQGAVVFAVLTFFVFLAGTFHSAGATTNSWTWGGSGFWHHGTNWSAGVPSTNTSHVQITVAGLAKTIIVDPETPLTNLTINALRVISSTSSRSNWLVFSNLNAVSPFRIQRGVTVGGPGTVPGRLILTNSTVVVDGMAGSGLNASNGLVILQPGAELQLTNGAQVKIGLGGSGTMLIPSNTTVHVADSNFVAGINPGGVGNVILSGGTLDVGWTFTIGEDAGSTGHVVVASGLLRSVNTNANAEIGQHGGGQLTLSNGVCQFDDISVGRHEGSRGTFRIFDGLCDASDLSVGRFTNSVGLFSMTGGHLALSGHLYAGREGTGTVSVAGGLVEADDLTVACTNTSYGAATFSGGTSLFSSTLCIGSIGSTGAVTVSGGTFVCTNSASTGVVDVIAGTFTVSGGNVALDSVLSTNVGGRVIISGGNITADQFIISNGLPLVVGNGTTATTLLVGKATNVFANGLIVSSNATVVACGAIVGNVINNGTVLVDQPGSLIFAEGVTNNGTIIQTNGGAIEFRGPLVNNGTIIPKNIFQNRITTIERVGNANQVFFTTRSGFNYTLQFKDTLDATWQSLGTVPGNNLTNSLPDPATGVRRFYRISIQ
jgi:hypothetical protein